MEILTIVLQSLLALVFLMAGSGKTAGAKMHVEGFNHWELPKWFRVVTGIVEIIGGPRWSSATGGRAGWRPARWCSALRPSGEF